MLWAVRKLCDIPSAEEVMVFVPEVVEAGGGG